MRAFQAYTLSWNTWAFLHSVVIWPHGKLFYLFIICFLHVTRRQHPAWVRPLLRFFSPRYPWDDHPIPMGVFFSPRLGETECGRAERYLWSPQSGRLWAWPYLCFADAGDERCRHFVSMYLLYRVCSFCLGCQQAIRTSILAFICWVFISGRLR